MAVLIRSDVIVADEGRAFAFVSQNVPFHRGCVKMAAGNGPEAAVLQGGVLQSPPVAEAMTRRRGLAAHEGGVAMRVDGTPHARALQYVHALNEDRIGHAQRAGDGAHAVGPRKGREDGVEVVEGVADFVDGGAGMRLLVLLEEAGNVVCGG